VTGAITKPRILYVCHNHPALHPGGTEIFAYDLFQTVKRTGAADALFLACTNKVHRERRPGTNFQTVGRSADEVILWAGHFDRFYQSQIDLHGIVPEFSDLLRTFRPDIVHIHHTLLLGVEMLFLIRRMLPRARIVYTLHDYYPICANDGQMVTTAGHELCRSASPDACHRCFPETEPDRFRLREKHIKAMFGTVDHFIAPSHFLRDRYIAWGLSPERISVVRNGLPAAEPAPPRPLDDNGRRNVFGYFGNVNPYKGVRVALDAARRLTQAGETDFTLEIHGGMPFQTDAFKAEIEAAIAAGGGRVTHHGPYRREDIARRLAGVDWAIVPSIWWENAPLVIQEAFQQRRPVLCSDIGGMAEAVRDGRDGLHFRAGDATDLARVMRRALDDRDLWDRLYDGIPAVVTMADSAAEHGALYHDLLSCGPIQAGSLAR
jgi:glycosyltransferase involved in cell wall biosynthesis